MNKLWKLALSGPMVFSLAACGSKGDSATDTEKEDTAKETETTKDDKTSSGNTYEDFEDLPRTLEMIVISDDRSKFKYSVGVPTLGAQGIAKGRAANIGENSYIVYGAFLGNPDSAEAHKQSEFKKNEDIPVILKEDMLKTLATYDYSEAKDFVIEKNEDKTINGWDFTRSTGYVQLENTEYKDNKLNFVLYTLMFNGCPIYFAGVDGSEAQDQFAYVEKWTDMTAKTFRETEETK